MPANLRRWWTESTLMLHWENRTPLNGWTYPIVPVTREFQRDFVNAFRVFLARYRQVHYDFNRDLDVYAWWPIAPLVRVAYWWRYGTALRWSIERWLNRRVADKREWETYNFALLGHWRPLRAWTWRRTRYTITREFGGVHDLTCVRVTRTTPL